MAKDETPRASEDKGENFDHRKARIKRRLKYINVASILCLFLLPFWMWVRLFFCWSESCTGIWCWFCGLSWLISGLLLIALISFVGMSLELFRISSGIKEPLPSSIERPWVPGTKQTIKGMRAVADGVRTLSSRVPGAEKVAQAGRRILSGVSAIPGIPALQEKAKAGYKKAYTTISHMERGRSIVKGTGPEGWTLSFTVVALLVAIYLMIGPFNNIFWSL